jgi:hypothetical protein
MLNEGKQIYNFIYSSGSGTVNNYGSGSDFLTNSGSTSQNVTVPTVPVPVPQHWRKVVPKNRYLTLKKPLTVHMVTLWRSR